MKHSGKIGGLINVNDDRLVGWMLGPGGYTYDFDSGEWKHKKDGKAPDKRDESKSLVATYRGRAEHPGSTLYELDRISEEVSNLIDEFGTLKEIEQTERDRLLSDFSPFRPITAEKERRDAWERTDELVRDFAEDKIGRLKTDVEFAHDLIKDVDDTEELNEAERRIKENTEDTNTVLKVLQKPITWAEKRISKKGALRELGRTLESDELKDTGIDTVEIFADQYGWDRDDADDIAEVKEVLKDKGAEFTKTDRYGNQKFKLTGEPREAAEREGFKIEEI